MGLSTSGRDKRHAPRFGLTGSATADFLSPAELRIANLSREGVGLTGVMRIISHETGMLTLYLPGTDEPTTVVASLAWSDRKGRVGLKFIEFRTIATQWRTWFTSPAEEEHSDADEQSTVPTRVSDELAAAWRDSAPELRSVWEQAERKSRWTRWIGRGIRAAAIALIVAVTAVAVVWAWQNSLHQAAIARLRGSPSKPIALTSVANQPAQTMTSVQLAEGEPSLEVPSRNGGRPLIDRGKATHQPQVAYTGSPLAVGEQIIDVLLAIDEKGIVTNVTLVRGNPALARDVISRLGHFRYTPFLVDSTPIGIKLPVRATFRTTRIAAAGAGKK